MVAVGNEARIQRWSTKRKTEAVLHRMRGEKPEDLSRDLQVAPIVSSTRDGRF